MGADHGSDASLVERIKNRPRFQRAHAGDLQMLVGRRRIAEPSVVGDIDEQGGIAEHIELAAAERILIANRDAELLAGCAQRRLARRPAVKSSYGKLISRIQDLTHEGTGKYSPNGTSGACSTNSRPHCL